jgi:hypothetical protein
MVDRLGEGWRVDVQDDSDLAGSEEFTATAMSPCGKWRVYDNTCCGQPLFRAIPEMSERQPFLDVVRIPAAHDPITALEKSRKHIVEVLCQEIERLHKLSFSLGLSLDKPT